MLVNEIFMLANIGAFKLIKLLISNWSKGLAAKIKELLLINRLLIYFSKQVWFIFTYDYIKSY